MEKVNEAKVTFTIEFDYTDCVNDIIEEQDDRFEDIEGIKEMLSSWVVDDIRDAGVELDNLTITIDE